MSDYIDNIRKSTIVEVECSYGKELILSELYEKIYRQGKADAIDEFVNTLPDCDYVSIDLLCTIAEQIKEKTND